MKPTTFHSKNLNLIVDIVDGEATVDEVIDLKAHSVKAGLVNEDTRVLAIVIGDTKILLDESRRFAQRLMAELPEYNGTRTAIQSYFPNTTARNMILARDIAESQMIGVFSTIESAIDWLGLDREELLQEIPAVSDYFI